MVIYTTNMCHETQKKQRQLMLVVHVVRLLSLSLTEVVFTYRRITHKYIKTVVKCYMRKIVSPIGDCLGQLRTDGPQMLHGYGSNPIGGVRPQHDGD